MDPHRLAERRSLAYHGIVAERLLRDGELLVRARRRVSEWLATPSPPHHATRWASVLARGAEAVAAFITESSEDADELRQSSPFAGVLTARERWAVWRSVARKDADS